MKLVVTIDTEEDNWARYSATLNPVENVKRVPQLQKCFDYYSVKPVYLLTYPVVTDQNCIEILKRILDDGKCEIGMHCHPWNTPPLKKKKNITESESMLCNLDSNSIHEKINFLHYTIVDKFDVAPTSFRAGRWGFCAAVADALLDLEYTVDSSVTPLVSWKCFQGPDYTDFGPEWFRFGSNGAGGKGGTGPLLEVPVTINFLQKRQERARRIAKATKSLWARKIHLGGILERMRLLNLVWLSPELSTAKDMIALAKRMDEKGFPFVNLTFHSTSLKGGLSPFVRSESEEKLFFEKLSSFLRVACKSGWESVTLAELEKATSLRKYSSKSILETKIFSQSKK